MRGSGICLDSYRYPLASTLLQNSFMDVFSHRVCYCHFWSRCRSSVLPGQLRFSCSSLLARRRVPRSARSIIARRGTRAVAASRCCPQVDGRRRSTAICHKQTTTTATASCDDQRNLRHHRPRAVPSTGHPLDVVVSRKLLPPPPPAPSPSSSQQTATSTTLNSIPELCEVGASDTNAWTPYPTVMPSVQETFLQNAIRGPPFRFVLEPWNLALFSILLQF